MRKNTSNKLTAVSRLKTLETAEENNSKVREFEETAQKVQISEENAITRLDDIDNAVWDAILAFLGLERDCIDWNMEYIGEVADAIYETMICMGLSPEYPYREDAKDGGDIWFVDRKKE